MLIVGRAHVARVTSEAAATERARRRYDDGVARGYGVELVAFWIVGSFLGCRVWNPASPDESERMLMMPQRLKLSLRERLPHATAVGLPSFLIFRMIGRRLSDLN